MREIEYKERKLVRTQKGELYCDTGKNTEKEMKGRRRKTSSILNFINVLCEGMKCDKVC